MINLQFHILLRFFFLILLQVLILNNINLGGFINPYLYVLFVLMLPMETPGWLVLLSAFFLGLGIDIFMQTLGIHSASTVFMAYCRRYVLRLLSPRDGYDFGLQPSIRDMGFTWYFSFAGILILLHHCLLFFLEVFRFSEFFATLGRTVMSTFFTLLLVILCQFLAYKKPS